MFIINDILGSEKIFYCSYSDSILASNRDEVKKVVSKIPVNIRPSAIDLYTELRVRETNIQISTILKSYKSYPYEICKSRLYYFESTGREIIENDEIKNQPLICEYSNLFNSIHGIKLDDSCIYQQYSKNIGEQHHFHKLSKKHFYYRKYEGFNLEIENISLSSVFSIYLEYGDNKCGTYDKDKSKGSDIYQYTGVKIPSEINFGPVRFYKFGPFSSIGSPKTVKICACSSNGSENDTYSCLRKEDFRDEIGDIIVTDFWKHDTKTLFVGESIKVKVENKISILIDTEVIGKCSKIFEKYSINWVTGNIKLTPNLSKHIHLGRKIDDHNYFEATPGTFNVCLIENETGVVHDYFESYRISGVKDNVETFLHMDSSKKLHGQAITIEAFFIEEAKIDSVSLMESEDHCTGEVMGTWSDGPYPYPISNLNKSSKMLIYTGFSANLYKENSAKTHRICIRYRDDSKLYPIGHAKLKNYYEYNLQHPIYSNFLLGFPPYDVINYDISDDSRIFKTWINQNYFFSQNLGNHEYEEKEIFYGQIKPFVDKFFGGMIHFQTYPSENALVIWTTGKGEMTLFPIWKVGIESPLSLRMTVISGTIYWYVLMRSTNMVVRYDVMTLKNRYTISDVKVFNDIKLYNPTAIEILQSNKITRILVLDSATNCIHLFSEHLKVIKMLCRSNQIEFGLSHPTSLSCVLEETSSGKFHCFSSQSRCNSILWFSVDITTDEIAQNGNYESGTLVDDLDPMLGVPTSLAAFNYKSSKIHTIVIIFTRENDRNGYILSANTITKQMTFMTSTQTIPGDKRLKLVRIFSNMSEDMNLMFLGETLTEGAVKQRYTLDDILRNFGNPKTIQWYLTWNKLSNLVHIPEFKYDLPEWIKINDEYALAPKVKNYQRFPQNLEYSISSEDGDVKNDDNFFIDPVSGILKVTVKRMKTQKIKFKITASILGLERVLHLETNITCLDGEYYNGSTCVSCPLASYNSISMVKNDGKYWSLCKSCPENETTKNEGSTSEGDCTCKAGYSVIKNDDMTLRCKPCPRGTYKNVIGFDNCIDSCYKNSVSEVIGSTTEEERFCKCLPGYYWGGHYENTTDCLECEKGFYCEGGFKSKFYKCPLNTTTKNKLATSIDDCICKAGYEPVDPVTINTSLEHSLRFVLMEKYKIMGKNPIICVPCPFNKYKESNSSDKCSYCPPNSFSKMTGNTKKSDCNRCQPGYYETNDEEIPCKPCLKGMICVGSIPKKDIYKQLAGKMSPCQPNSLTFPPYTNNQDPNYCLCDVGYVSGSNSVLNKCVQVPKNYYKDKVGNIPASACPNGSLTLAPGAVSKNACVCDKGYYFDNTSQHCTMCPNGKYCLGGKDENMVDRQPMDCQDTNAQTKYPGASSASECACKPGYYANTDAQNACTECPENHYKSYISNDACVRCDENSSTNGKTGATSKEQCVCDPGYYFDKSCVACDFRDKFCPGGLVLKRDSDVSTFETRPPEKCPENTEIPPGVDNASSIDYCQCSKGYAFASKDLDNNIKTCTPCPPGTYKSSVMDSNCNGLCTQNATSLQGAKSPMQCFCQMGYFYLAGGICTKCLEGSRCDGGLTNTRGITEEDVDVDIDDHTKPVAIEGYYLDKINQKLRKPDDWKFIKCPIKGACLGGGKCSKSMEHYLCSECKKGYTNNFTKGAICQKCPNMAINLSVIMVWYFILLLINIVMACLNVSAGFNRRSIHSVVIKIALNYCICTSVLNVVNFDDLNLPKSVKSFTTSWIKMFDSDDIVYYTSIDCILRSWFNLNHADSFFYAMLYMFFLPVILLFVVTVLMWTILELFKIKRYKVTTAKLALLQQSKARGLEPLAERLRDEYANERLFLIFRYIPLPGETKWTKSVHFIEDMIPIYVTVLFSVHGKITSKMLGLLDCVYIDLGRSIPGKYMLRPAMSVRCSLNPSHGYIPYLALGMTGLIIWGFGIPFLSFMVLYVNRKNLYAPDIRMKYGFLHNGFRQDYWYWETVVFTRKSLVLVIGSIVIVPSQNLSGSRIWMALVVAVIFLIIQLFYKPFDERDYFVLGKLESHSMIAWTLTLIFASLIIEVNFTDWDNMWLLGLTIVFNSLFIAEVFYELFIAYFSSFRLFRKCLNLFPFRKEPMVSYYQNQRIISLSLQNKDTSWKISPSSIANRHERYFITTLGELYRIALSHLRLDVLPSTFIEFLVRFSISFSSFEEKMIKERVFKSFSEGKISNLIVLAREQESANFKKIVNLDKVEAYYRLNKTESIFDKDYLGVIGLKKENINSILDSMFNENILTNKRALSDIYLSLAKICNMDKNIFLYIFSLFKCVKEYMEMEAYTKTLERLENIRSDLKVKRDEDEMKQELNDMQSQVDELKKRITIYKDKLEMLEYGPDTVARKDALDPDFCQMMQDFGFGLRDK
ncbi:conserved hypothetical protein [Theileria equi strain WA]|uniref:Uncharacterized protein n=1 Tax=Theileria equi strain WA TaxID=1537102 RepID=L1LG30_THEEQ|nr:conserved hypothetical protein [Theileria equi strain WA]EKX74220.1 conserved hypothetical protein [Theileria equi strain WA]|eukprot:XP_004833672.1 conserved hypothetical protein [Theileria equi strain WA]